MEVTAPELHSFPLILKATPKVEGGERIVFCEPSNEHKDLEGESVFLNALMESRDYYMAKGNLDIDHRSIKHMDRRFEIGRPRDVRFDGGRIFLKGVIYQGSGLMVEKANEFWSSITDLMPPMPWYPSVGGHILKAGNILPKGELAPVKAIRQVLWNNTAFSREPVNPTVPGVSLVPLGAFAKAWIGQGSTLEYVEVTPEMAKTLEAGYGTDLAALSGGAALRKESLHGVSKAGALQLAKDFVRGRVRRKGPHLQAQDLIEHLQAQGLSDEEANEAVTHFLSALSTRKGATNATH